MRRASAFLLMAVVLGLTYSLSLTGAQEHPSPENELTLSKKLLRILSAEMNAVQSGMTNFAVALPAARWDDIVQTASMMKGGYVMQKLLSEKEMNEFYRSLPAGYKELDGQFYAVVDRLRQAAGQHNAEEVNRYICQLNESCVQCHSKYATERFPDFK